MNFLQKTSSFIKTSLIGGFLVLIPLYSIYLIFNWIFNLLRDNVKPIKETVSPYINEYITLPNETLEITIIISSLLILTLISFATGLIFRTTLGATIENILRSIPGYTLIKNTLSHFIKESKENEERKTILIKPYGNETLMTGFIVEKGEKYSTVFVPTSPNPTSGLIMHVLNTDIIETGVSYKEGMETIISIGIGSNKMLKKI